MSTTRKFYADNPVHSPIRSNISDDRDQVVKWAADAAAKTNHHTTIYCTVSTTLPSGNVDAITTRVGVVLPGQTAELPPERAPL